MEVCIRSENSCENVFVEPEVSRLSGSFCVVEVKNNVCADVESFLAAYLDRVTILGEVGEACGGEAGCVCAFEVDIQNEVLVAVVGIAAYLFA